MPENGSHPMAMNWDSNMAAAAIVLGALAFLLLVRRGFRGFIVQV